jgi:NAD(P)-dependent dehydrogenase (short-subunit alcohol dehydrogenase family)
VKKNILVIGASSGIGQAVCQKLIAQEYKVFGTYNSQATELAVGENYSEFPLDLTKIESLESSLQEIDKKMAPLHGLVYCSGIIHSGPLMSLSTLQIIEQMQVNLLGATIAAKVLLPGMVQRRSGNIILLGSVSAHRVIKGHSIYSATKAGLEGFCRALASEVAKRNIRVNCVLPGPVKTKMLEKSMQETGDDPVVRIPMGQLIGADDIANTVSFLLGDESRNITGTSIPVDGGYLLW